MNMNNKHSISLKRFIILSQSTTAVFMNVDIEFICERIFIIASIYDYKPKSGYEMITAFSYQ